MSRSGTPRGGRAGAGTAAGTAALVAVLAVASLTGCDAASGPGDDGGDGGDGTSRTPLSSRADADAVRRELEQVARRALTAAGESVGASRSSAGDVALVACEPDGDSARRYEVSGFVVAPDGGDLAAVADAWEDVGLEVGAPSGDALTASAPGPAGVRLGLAVAAPVALQDGSGDVSRQVSAATGCLELGEDLVDELRLAGEGAGG